MTNRRMRNRMSGGVRGGAGDRSSYSIRRRVAYAASRGAGGVERRIRNVAMPSSAARPMTGAVKATGFVNGWEF